MAADDSAVVGNDVDALAVQVGATVIHSHSQHSNTVDHAPTKFSATKYWEENFWTGHNSQTTASHQEIASLNAHLYAITNRSQHGSSLVELPDDETTKTRKAAEAINRRKCVVCLQDFLWWWTIILPCGDRYCVECLKQKMFTRAANGEQAFPVKCHNIKVPLKLIAKHMSKGEIRLYKRVRDEYTTLCGLYCNHPDCGQFIADQSNESVPLKAICCKCKHATCRGCGESYHFGSCLKKQTSEECEVASAFGSQKCFNCEKTISSFSRCNHVICECRAEFCYICGVEWKQCRCPVFGIRGLMAAYEHQENPYRPWVSKNIRALIDFYNDTSIEDMDVKVYKIRLGKKQEDQILNNVHNPEDEYGDSDPEEVGRISDSCRFCGTQHHKFILLNCGHGLVHVCVKLPNNGARRGANSDE
ncbi:hypothetical protein DM02DRAFT_688575 [Periconia macrospinosa]|uniref:RING-type domain-containing protein n=1 Tax=Periconia macrospinosa TaxID=97972 RepID=A0A2V1DDQ8_9PLEO|nr:hypothetical protein DM02DRAFT_688575 [Periconia macrospinosa]